MRYHDNNITKLEPSEIFVFGANLAGAHGAGAARQAMKFGAVYGRFGLVGQTYGIPTKDKNLKTLPLSEIKHYIDLFEGVVRDRQDLTFLITKVGCGLANLKEWQIKPMFENFYQLSNVVMPIWSE
jgi:hypothetical protein